MTLTFERGVVLRDRLLKLLNRTVQTRFRSRIDRPLETAFSSDVHSNGRVDANKAQSFVRTNWNWAQRGARCYLRVAPPTSRSHQWFLPVKRRIGFSRQDRAAASLSFDSIF